jgi:hypothetical protein
VNIEGGNDAESVDESVLFIARKAQSGIDIVGLAQGVNQDTRSEVKVVADVAVGAISELVDGCTELISEETEATAEIISSVTR